MPSGRRGIRGSATPDQIKANVAANGQDRRIMRAIFEGMYVRLAVHPRWVQGRADRWQEVRFEPEVGMVLRVNAGGCNIGTGAHEGKCDHGFMLPTIIW
jgi:hypothetical protein